MSQPFILFHYLTLFRRLNCNIESHRNPQVFIQEIGKQSNSKLKFVTGQFFKSL